MVPSYFAPRGAGIWLPQLNGLWLSLIAKYWNQPHCGDTSLTSATHPLPLFCHGLNGLGGIFQLTTNLANVRACVEEIQWAKDNCLQRLCERAMQILSRWCQRSNFLLCVRLQKRRKDRHGRLTRLPPRPLASPISSNWLSFCLFVFDQALSSPLCLSLPISSNQLLWLSVVITFTGCSHHFPKEPCHVKNSTNGWHPPTDAKVKTNKMKEKAYLLRIMIMMITIMMRTRLWFKRSESELLPNTNPAGHFRWRPNVVWCSSGMQGLLCACHAILKYKNRRVLMLS